MTAKVTLVNKMENWKSEIFEITEKDSFQSVKHHFSPKQETQWSVNCRIRLMRLAIIKRASQDEEQNQTTLGTNINYIQNFMFISLKKANVLIRSK